MKRGITYKLLRSRPLMLAAFVVCAAMAALFTMATALSVTDFLQLIFPSGESSALSVSQANPVEKLLSGVYDMLIEQGPMRALLLYAFLLFGLYGFKNICSYLSSVSFANVKISALRDVRNDLHKSALAYPFSRWSNQQQGQWLSYMSNDIVEYEANVLDSIQMLVQSLLTMLIYVFMLLYLDWRMTLFVVLIMGIGAALLSVSRRLKRQSRQLQALNGELLSTTQETLESLKEIKAATAIDYVNERQRRQNIQFTRRRIGIYRRIYAASPISDFVGNVIVVLILVLGAQRVLGDSASLSPALFVSYIMIYVLLLTPIKELSNAIAQLKKGRGIEERLSDVLETPDACSAAETTSIDGNAIESVELRDVSFSYGDVKVLEHLNLELPMHCHTAVIGESGSGKTTLGRLLVGLLQPQSGEVLFDGKPTTESMRAGRVAYIPQEPMLFNDTIESNIRFGRNHISDEDINEAIRMAQLEPLIGSLPAGLKTFIGDDGGRLSGGERQRIAIARALAGNPSIVVMDEATAALDAATEQHFSEAVREAMQDRTMVVIAHRSSTIDKCDHVFSIERKEFVR
ncbi:MAG: ABC transporter ATP-binding protein [Bacteroidales bacterium]|nr:ABC transporter ATP-binding protein [Bacteroidales bacterium]